MAVSAVEQSRWRRWWHSRFGAAFGRELALVVGLLVLYKYGRTLVRGEGATAIEHARELMRLERDMGIFTEERLQDAFLQVGTSVEWMLNAYYLYAHVVVTAAAFLWLYARHPKTYRRFRNVMVAMTVAGLALHLLYPLAPPRMFPHLGFVDLGRTVGPASYGHGSPYQGFANQFAAMPSLHFGWALAIAWAAIIAKAQRELREPLAPEPGGQRPRRLASPSSARWLVVAHPVLTLAAIVLTANHYWLDAFVALLLFVGALLLDRRLEARKVRRARPAAPGCRPESASARECPATPTRT
jgi:hypothetical protein